MIAIISDLHIGVHRSDPKYLGWVLQYGEFLKKKLEEKNCKQLFILGDVFHDRKEVSTVAIETARKFFSLFDGYSVEVIPGNHDCYYENNTNATSLALLSGWSNIHVHYEPYEINTLNDDALGLIVPWGFDPTKFESDTKYSFLMGHFDITSFNMTSTQICENGWSSDDLFKIAPLVFSGHFHLRSERNYDGGKKIIYVGSPYELDWGDYGSEKGIYFYEIDTGKIEFVKNDFSPKHVRLQYDPDIATDKEKAAIFKNQLKQVQGNIVKLVSESSSEIKQRDLQKVIEIVGRLNPGEFTCDLKSYNDDEKIELEISSNLDPKDALLSYIDATCKDHVNEIKAVIMNLFNQTKKG